MKSPWLAILGLLLASCGSSRPTGTNLGAPPESFLSYPAHSSEGIVNASAKYAYPADQKREFLTNILDDVQIIPVELRVNLRGEGADEAQIKLTPDSMNLRLYLQNGVALSNVDIDEFMGKLAKKPAIEIRNKKFNGGLLKAADTSGYLYFAIHPKDKFQVEGDKLIYTADGVTRSLDIDRSLLAFDVIIDDHPRPFYVGIRP